MAVSTIKSERRYGTILNTTSTNGTYNLLMSIQNATELVFQLTISNVVRCSAVLTKAQFITNGAFPDFTLGSQRAYCDIQYVSDNSIRISNVTGYSSLGATAGIRIIAK